ncbi:MAG: hypothetical protein M0P64_04640 [Candidatus Pacebacteria bacterium]|jgi:hypothetical protein|nr:hypothetical protein [Candidatus Paceibacterota bacterium]
MQGIEFEDEKDLGIVSAMNNTPAPEGKPSFMVQTLEKMGVVDKSTANLILLAAAAIIFGLTIFMYANLFGDSMPSQRTAEQIQAQLRVIREMQQQGVK